jgi:hypothetical protein
MTVQNVANCAILLGIYYMMYNVDSRECRLHCAIFYGIDYNVDSVDSAAR